MAQRDLNLGTPPAGTDGDTVRQAFEKVQANTTELYATKQDGIEGLTSAGINFLQAGDAPGQRTAIGLGNVDNTSDANKPVSTAQQAALDSKQDTLTPGDNITINGNVISSKVDGIPTNTDGLAEGSNNLYFTAARVRSTVLTGLAAGVDAAIAATDTLLQALAKLQAQLAAKLTNPMTAPGDLIVGGTSGAATRLPIGTAGQGLRVNPSGTGLEFTSNVLSVVEVGGTAINGYRKYSDGTIEQWGIVSVPNTPVESGNLFSWNTPFLERVESFVAMPTGVGRSTQGEPNNTCRAESLTMFRISSGMAATPLNYNWFARGR